MLCSLMLWISLMSTLKPPLFNMLGQKIFRLFSFLAFVPKSPWFGVPVHADKISDCHGTRKLRKLQESYQFYSKFDEKEARYQRASTCRHLGKVSSSFNQHQSAGSCRSFDVNDDIGQDKSVHEDPKRIFEWMRYCSLCSCASANALVRRSKPRGLRTMTKTPGSTTSSLLTKASPAFERSVALRKMHQYYGRWEIYLYTYTLAETPVRYVYAWFKMIEHY